MIHDLDEINAALKLGDRFLPPVGSTVLVAAPTGEMVTGKVILSWVQDRMILFRCEVEVPDDSFRRHWSFFASRIVEYTHIPFSLPAFSEWERP